MAQSEPGLDPLIVFDWLDSHCTKRESDGRYLTMNGRLIDDSHRDTLDRWREKYAADWLVPLGRFDELLLAYGVMLWEFEMWATELYGGTGEQP